LEYRQKSKAIPLQAWTGPEVSRKLRIPDFKKSAPAAFTPRKYSCYSFLLEAESTQGHSAAGRIMSMKNSNDTIGNRTRNLPACSAVPQPTAPPHLPNPVSDRRGVARRERFVRPTRVQGAEK